MPDLSAKALKWMFLPERVEDDYIAEFFDFRTISSSLRATVVHWPLYFLSPSHWVRIKAMNIVNDGRFSGGILLVILVNSILLALDDPTGSSSSSLQQVLNVLDVLFLAVFIVEMCLKVTAFGFIMHRYSYLRDTWNILDFVVVVAGIVQAAAGASGLTALRVFRVFRPLRSVSQVEALREILNKLVASIPRLSDVFALMLFISWFAAVLGINLFAGIHDLRCFYDDNYYNLSQPVGTWKLVMNMSTFICDDSSDSCSSMSGLAAPMRCMYAADLIPSNLLSFSNIGTSLLLSLKLISRDNWATQISAISSGVGVGSFFYFFLVTFFGGYFCLNLFIAVLTSAFQVTDDVESARKEFPYRMRFAHALGGTIFCDSALALCHESRHQAGSAPSVVVGADGAFHKVKSKKPQRRDQSAHSHLHHLGAALQNLELHQQRQQQRQQQQDEQNPGTEMTQVSGGGGGGGGGDGAVGAGDHHHHRQGGHEVGGNDNPQPQHASIWDDLVGSPIAAAAGGGGGGGGGRHNRLRSVGGGGNSRRNSGEPNNPGSTSTSSSDPDSDHGLDEVAAARMALSRRRANLMAASIQHTTAAPSASTTSHPASGAADSAPETQNAPNEPFFASQSGRGELANNSSEAFIQHQQQQLLMMRQQQQDFILQRQQLRQQLEIQQRQQEKMNRDKRKKVWWRWSNIKRWSRKTGWEPLRGLVISVPYTLFVMSVVLAFAIALSLDGVNRSDSVSNAIDRIALGCNIFFIVDVVLKIIGLGPSFIYSVSNWMDFVLAALSVPDLVAQSSNALSALRAFRLLRLLRIAKQWKSLQRLLSLVLSSLKSVASLSLVALIFIYIFAILGFQLFTVDIPDARFSFASVFDSLLTVFVIVTGENWSDMTAAMVPNFGYGCILYFVPIFIIGNFFIANLFIAIIIDSFSEVGRSGYDSDDDDDDDDGDDRDGDGSSDDDEGGKDNADKNRSKNSNSSGSDDDDDDDGDGGSRDDRERRGQGRDGENAGRTNIDKNASRRRRRRRKARLMEQQEHRNQLAVASKAEETDERDTDEASLPSEVRARYMGASSDLLSVLHSQRQVLVPCDDSSDDEPVVDGENGRGYEGGLKNTSRGEAANLLSGVQQQHPQQQYFRSPLGLRNANSNSREVNRRLQEENTTLQLANRLGLNATFAPDPRQPAETTTKEAATAKLLKDFVHRRNITTDTLSLVPDCDLLSRAAAREMEHVERIRHEEQRLAQHAVAFVTLSRVKKQADGAGGSSSNVYGKLRDDKAKEEFRTLAEQKSLEEKYEGTNYRSLFYFEPDNKYRMKMVEVLRHPVFNYGILLLIVISSFLLALDTPTIVNSIPNFELGLTITDYVIAIAFSLEMVVRIISLGAFLHPGAYFLHVWNVVDFLVTLLSIIALGVPALKPVRIIRVVRLTNQTFHMRIVITSLLQALPGMSSVLVFMLFVWWIFAIVGVASFKGTFDACNDISKDQVDCVGNYTVENTQFDGRTINVTVARKWASLLPSSNFDDVPSALYTLLKLSLGDGWFAIMYTALDSPGAGLAPVRNSNAFAALFFVVFMIAGNFFIMNLFVGVLADRFVTLRERGNGYHLLSEAQKQWVLAQRVLFRTEVPVTPPCPTNAVRRWCFHEVQTKHFDYFFTGIIVLQSIQLSMYTAHMTASYESVLDGIGIVMLCLFTIEIVMKMLAFNPILYWRTTWNRIDLLIVGMSWLGVFIGNSISLVRVFRVFRLILLLRKLQGIQTLFIALFQAIPELINVGVVLGVVYAVFAVIGVALFSNIPATDPLSSLVNFQNVGSALIALYVSMTTDGWDAIADACGAQPPDCDPDAGTCGNRALAYFYFILYMFVMSMILVNLLVTVVLGNFNDAEIAEEQESLLQVIQEFRDRWAENDADGTQKLDVSVVLRLLPTLPPAIWDHNPLKVRGRSLPMWIHFLRQLQRFHVPIAKDHSCTYRDVVASLALRLFCVNVQDAIRSSRTTSEGVTWDAKVFSIHHQFAALKLSRVARRFIRARGERLALRQLREIKEQHTILIEAEYVPLRRSHEVAVALARFALKRAAEAHNQAAELRRKLEELTDKNQKHREELKREQETEDQQKRNVNTRARF